MHITDKGESLLIPDFTQGADYNTPQYSISEVSEKTGISAFTLRYYDKCGFFPQLHRDKNNVRCFSKCDIDELHLVDALRKSGLSIEGIQYFVRLSLKGNSSSRERLTILQAQETVLEYQRDEIDESLKTLHHEKILLEKHE